MDLKKLEKELLITDSAYYNKLVDKYAQGNQENICFLRHLEEKDNLRDIKHNVEYHEKKFWSFFADVIICRNKINADNELQCLFKWLQDLNWSGSIKIYDFLKNLSYETFNENIILSLCTALKQNDDIWASNLVDLIIGRANTIGISNGDIKDLKQKIAKLQNNLKKADIDFEQYIEGIKKTLLL